MRLAILLFVLLCPPLHADTPSLNPENVDRLFAGREGSLVLIACEENKTTVIHPGWEDKPFAPCSTFKIWNTLFGLEAGVLHAANEPFYRWDGEKRFIPEWNQDLTLRQAFQVSCVPAYQELARSLGTERMQKDLDRLGYGNRDLSAGIDVFWLPHPGRRTILISAREQAELARRLALGDVPFSERSQKVLREIMTVRQTLRGALFGKTGSSGKLPDGTSIGWYVGYVESNGKSHAFACLLKGGEVTGKDARAVVEAVAVKEGWL